MVTMFEKIGDVLPGYAQYFNQIMKRETRGNQDGQVRSSIDDPSRQRISKALSYVYTDIVEFCQEACDIFSSQKRGGFGLFGLVLLLNNF